LPPVARVIAITWVVKVLEERLTQPRPAASLAAMRISYMGQRASFRLRCIPLVAVGAWALLSAASAQAATVTVGSPLSASFEKDQPCTQAEGCTTALLKLAEPGAHAASPLTGTIVRWRVKGTTANAGYALSVLRSNGPGSYTVTASSPYVAAAGHDVETFTSVLPVHAGEFIALSRPYDANIAILESPSSEAFFTTPLAIGQTRLAEEEGAFPYELGFSADVQPPPGITAITPASGSISGSTSVTITGHDFTEASAVKFGSTPASSFTVNSETQIAAVAPPSAIIGAVDTSVTTPAGTTPTSAADQFTYTAEAVPSTVSCIVPNLKGKSLKATRKSLTRAKCKLGKVKGQKSTTAKVVKQNPKSGRALAPGAKVNVTVN
jgi:IPT/TIG domain/PASTA domain